MTSQLRFIPDEAKLWTDSKGRPIAIAEVTVRTVQGRFLLQPTPDNTRLILGVLGRAQARLDFELYAYAYLSNHGSILVGVRSAHHLARVMNYIHGNIPKELGRKENSDWSGKFWCSRPARGYSRESRWFPMQWEFQACLPTMLVNTSMRWNRRSRDTGRGKRTCLPAVRILRWQSPLDGCWLCCTEQAGGILTLPA